MNSDIAPRVPVQPTASDATFYYLRNFLTALDWIGGRHDDLLLAEEREFLRAFAALPVVSQALLVRMIMRKGVLFRGSKLLYPEIGDAASAMGPLLECGWVSAQMPLAVEQLFASCTRAELNGIEALSPGKALRKAEWLAVEMGRDLPPRAFCDWSDRLGELYRLEVRPFCERLRLMFFGNLHQDWSEFVLAELEIRRYFPVVLDRMSRGFTCRSDVDRYLALHQHREAFESGGLSLDEVLDVLDVMPLSNPWVEERRARLHFRVAQQCERAGRFDDAARLYTDCRHPGSRSRLLRVYERQERLDEALILAERMLAESIDEAERQHLERFLPRLRRKLGLQRLPRAAAATTPRIEFSLPRAGVAVEQMAALRLQSPGAPVYYVENLLFNALFGLLCWEAVFAVVPGAFFHPFHSGPADLFTPGFRQRRQGWFDACFAQLDDGRHRETILNNYRRHQGFVSPFVHWGGIDEALLELALDCIPAEHLRACFDRLLLDVKANRAGLPDLIQFWPEERRYRMIEVKGPGDRLQDNQLRWLAFFEAQGMPASVCYVSWAEVTA